MARCPSSPLTPPTRADGSCPGCPGVPLLSCSGDDCVPVPSMRRLKAKSEENKARRKRELEDKYCRRQAELGVGDCAGLRDIPGMTSSGRQKPPKAIMDLFGLTDEDYDGIQGN